MAAKADRLASGLAPFLGYLARTDDVHVGVIASSLGSMGGDLCPDEGPTNGLAHLRTRGPGGAVVAAAAEHGFLAFDRTTYDLPGFTRDVQALVRGVGEEGCHFSSPLEAAYRFLVQPDPWARIAIDGTGRADLGTDVDGTVIAQRRAFLRPGSVVVVIVVTDRDDAVVDPRAVGGSGWAYASTHFPGSSVTRADGTTTAPRATSMCATNPVSPDCTSCGFAATCDQSQNACLKIRSDASCLKNGGWLLPEEDPLGLRFHRTKARYGISPQFPLRRYLDGFTKFKVPDRSTEHLVDPRTKAVKAYGDDVTCTNPLFAAQLPNALGDELCNLPRSMRSPDDVVFAVLGGAVPGLTTFDALLGKDPAVEDVTGIEPHMLPSPSPRPGLAPPSDVRGDLGPDPVHGRELDPACECATPARNPPLCTAKLGEQIRAAATPSSRVLQVARALGDAGVVGSVCARPMAFLEAVTARIQAILSRPYVPDDGGCDGFR